MCDMKGRDLDNSVQESVYLVVFRKVAVLGTSSLSGPSSLQLEYGGKLGVLIP